MEFFGKLRISWMIQHVYFQIPENSIRIKKCHGWFNDGLKLFLHVILSTVLKSPLIMHWYYFQFYQLLFNIFSNLYFRQQRKYVASIRSLWLPRFCDGQLQRSNNLWCLPEIAEVVGCFFYYNYSFPQNIIFAKVTFIENAFHKGRPFNYYRNALGRNGWRSFHDVHSLLTFFVVENRCSEFALKNISWMIIY